MAYLIRITILIMLINALYSCANPETLVLPGNEISFDQPNYQTNESWTYDKHYPISCLTWKVDSFDSSEIVKLKCDNNEIHYSAKNSFNLVEAIADGKKTYTADPYWPHLSFPLHVGKCWNLSWEGADSTQDWSWTAYTRACVVSYEKVNVPAGTFDAMRIEYEDNFKCCNGVSGYDKLTTWYAPEVKTIIKFKSKRYPFWNHQLVKYNLNPNG